MLRTSFTLIAKKSLTHDVFELIYTCPDLEKEPPKPGQYVMFQLAPGLNRAYSIASVNITSPDSETEESAPSTFTLIIKRIVDGRGSPIICDAPVWSILNGMIPLGHFVLRNTQANKCFIGTGTGFAPLYCQILECQKLAELSLEQGGWGWVLPRVAFHFWVRSERDTFYTNELLNLVETMTGFEYIQYLSRPESQPANLPISKPATLQGYVTDWITEANIRDYSEFYICGSPAMVESARNKLTSLGVSKEVIYWEQY